ncbi:ERI1 exoribonuclease 2 [Lutzomyia longipalpis]|uniref:ERI1 exoribonuclease 2 n=1 Tax=Lutzomyia longipalpis TaxID=7200 RepID=UPI00248347A2|nr:ERI1 exoribonuclease 2 [Lutzomyia longipalpis]
MVKSIKRVLDKRMGFKYLLIIDFESTCWEGRVDHFNRWEIIEFPAVLLNLETGKIEKEFQRYVFPTENPKLSAFCTRLTGITQDQVDNGVPLCTCLMLFTNWVKEILNEKGLTFPNCNRDNLHGDIALATWTNWDLGLCLRLECSRKRLKKPSFCNQWIDIKKSFEDYFDYKPTSFQDALDFLGIEFVGRPHCGLDDSRNEAKLVAFMHQNGATFKITSNLLPPGKMNFMF